MVLLPAGMIITNIFFASHLISFYRFEAPLVYSSMTIALVASVFLVPLFGLIADLFKIKTVFMCACVSFSVMCPYMFSLLDTYSNWGIISFLVLWQVFQCACIACVLPWLTHLFPTEVRFTGVSLCYNLGYVMCAFLPNVYTLSLTTHQNVIQHILCIISGIGFFSALGTNQFHKIK